MIHGRRSIFITCMTDRQTEKARKRHACALRVAVGQRGRLVHFCDGLFLFLTESRLKIACISADFFSFYLINALVLPHLIMFLVGNTCKGCYNFFFLHCSCFILDGVSPVCVFSGGWQEGHAIPSPPAREGQEAPEKPLQQPGASAAGSG